MPDSNGRCGCGRAVGEVVWALTALGNFPEAPLWVAVRVKGKLKGWMGGALSERLIPTTEDLGITAGLKGDLKRHAGRWLLASVPVECGVERERLEPVLKSMDQGDWKDATAELLDLMKKCAGMTS